MIGVVDTPANPTAYQGRPRLHRGPRWPGRLGAACEGASSIEYALILVAIAIGSIVL